MKSDLDFVRKFYNKQFNIDKAKLDGIPLNEWIAKVEPKMDGNGFTFGNLNSSQSSDTRRSAFYCIAFDNKYGGFIDNYNHKNNASMSSCAAFNNYINYRLPYIFSSFEDNWSWLSKDSDQLNNVYAQKPSNSNTLNHLFYSIRDNIVKAISQNMFPDNINFVKSGKKL